eukprot:SAG22_NODE_5878_length_937_cov_1.546539_1_plen_132_part_00
MFALPNPAAFGGYEWLKANATTRLEEMLPAEDPTSPQLFVWVWTRLGCGWVAGLTASLFCYPADTVKRQMMLGGGKQTILGCVAGLYREGGISIFYRGCLLNAMNSGPALALTMLANETLLRVLKPVLNAS